MSVRKHSLYLALACPECGAEQGQPCLRLDGQPRSRTHIRRTPETPCGTWGGYQRHKKAGEDACEPCRDAHRRYVSEYRKRNPARRERDIALLRVRREATKALIARHRDEFDALMALGGT